MSAALQSRLSSPSKAENPVDDSAMISKKAQAPLGSPSPSAAGTKQKKADNTVTGSSDKNALNVKTGSSPVSTDAVQLFGSNNSSPSNKRNQSPSRTVGRYKRNTVFISSTANLMTLLSSGGTSGAVANKLLESTVHYQPERDAIHLRFFKAKDLNSVIFRLKLLNFFELSFSDDEFEFLCSLFEGDSSHIDGFEFMIFYIKLSTIRKDREALKHRESQEQLSKLREIEDERKKLEAEKKMSVSANYSFTNGIRASALSKLAAAAKGYDPTDTLCLQSNLDGYAGAVLNAGKILGGQSYCTVVRDGLNTELRP